MVVSNLIGNIQKQNYDILGQMFMSQQLQAMQQQFTSAMNKMIQNNLGKYQTLPFYEPTKTGVPPFEMGKSPNPKADMSVMIDGEYRLDVTKNGTKESTFKIYDKNGKELAGEWGDPHLTGKNGDAIGDLQCNHVLTLPNGSKVGVRVSTMDGKPPVPGQLDVVTELTVVSSNQQDAMNFNMNVGSSKPTTATPISGYVGEDFLRETLSDNGESFFGPVIGISQNGGMFDPETGQPMNKARLSQIDTMHPDPFMRENARKLAQAEELFNKGIIPPMYSKEYQNTNFQNFTPTQRDAGIQGLVDMLSKMFFMNSLGVGVDVRLPNHLNNQTNVLKSPGLALF